MNFRRSVEFLRKYFLTDLETMMLCNGEFSKSTNGLKAKVLEVSKIEYLFERKEIKIKEILLEKKENVVTLLHSIK